MGSLQVLLFYNLNDREFNVVNGSWSFRLNHLIDTGLFNLIPNPDKSDEVDPDLMLNTPVNVQLLLHFSVKQVYYLSWAKGQFSLFHCNITRLQKKFSLEVSFISLDKRPEILAINETRLNANSECSNVDLLNYEFYHTDSPTLPGGADMCITKTLKSTPRPAMKLNMQLVESCWVEIDPCNGKAHILIGCVYRHPGTNTEEFTQQLDDLIKKSQNRYQLYTLGDMNILIILKCYSHAQTEEYLDMFHSNNIILPIITIITNWIIG